MNDDSRVESEVNSPSNGEDSDEMPPLTESDSSQVESNDEFPPIPPLTNSEPSDSENETEEKSMSKHQNHKFKGAKRKVCKKRKPKVDPGLVNDSSEDSQGTSSDITTEDDYSDDEHVFLVSSVANLRRRELMNSQTQSCSLEEHK